MGYHAPLQSALFSELPRFNNPTTQFQPPFQSPILNQVYNLSRFTPPPTPPKYPRKTPRITKTRRSPKQESLRKTRIPNKQASPVPQTSTKERKLSARQEKLKRKNELRKNKKMSVRTEENLLCKWRIYGCTYSAKQWNPYRPSSTQIVNHEAVCDHMPKNLLARTLRWVKGFGEAWGETIPGLEKILHPGAAFKMKPVLALPAGQDPKIYSEKPVIFDSAKCWTSLGPPTPGDLFDLFFKVRLGGHMRYTPNKPEVFQIVRQIIFGDHKAPDVKAIYDLAVWQLYKEFEGQQLKNEMIIPDSFPMDDILSAYDRYDMTPRHAFTDLRIDRGLTTIAIHEGNLKNLWILYPPTATNLCLFHHHRHTGPVKEDNAPGAIFRTVAPLLMGGRICILQAGQSLLIPAGWLYSTLTLEGGYLAKKLFHHSKDLQRTVDYAEIETLFGNSHNVECVLGNLLACIEQLKRRNTKEDDAMATQLWNFCADCINNKRHRWYSSFVAQYERIYKIYFPDRPDDTYEEEDKDDEDKDDEDKGDEDKDDEFSN